MKTVWQILSLPFIALIKLYQLIISPWLKPSCRYTPTCSQYGIDALKKYGPIKGLWLTVKELLNAIPGVGMVTTRCHKKTATNLLQCIKIIKFQIKNAPLLYPSLPRSKTQPDNRLCDFDNLNNKHVPKHHIPRLVYLSLRQHPLTDYPG